MKKKDNEYWPGNYVIIESPFQGKENEVMRNIRYAQAAIKDSITHGEWPFASHLLYTQDNILRDDLPEERELGIVCGEMWSLKADLTVLYIDYGISPGMQRAIETAEANGRAMIKRKIGRK